jgi:hypothetical protein
MITCLLQGGLGNQMFQIAATYALAKRNNVDYGFDFNICHTPLQGNMSIKYTDNLFSNLNSIVYTPTFDIYIEPKFSYSEIPFKDNLLLKGFFQSEKYFIDYKDDIIKLFKINDYYYQVIEEFLRIKNIKKNDIITSIHVRRGDYLNLQEYHGICQIEYFKKAIEIIGDSKFIVLSDDINWVKENFIGDNFIFSDFKDEILDFILMTKCNNNIISNSSFSWWGAYLNKNDYKKIIAPFKWFGPKGPKDTQDIFPKNWKVI